MDKTRRSLILGASTLPLVGLTACGGGNGEPGTSTGPGGQAQAQAVSSTSSSTLKVVAANILYDSLFYSYNGGQYIVPTPNKMHACLNGNTMWVCISETIAPSQSVSQTYQRNLQLQVNNFSLSQGKTFTPGADLVLGNLVVNADDGTHADWEVGSSGSITSSAMVSSTSNGITTGQFVLTFNNLLVNITSSSKLQSNAARYAMLLTGYTTIPFRVEDAAWL